jgi:hypothetical protein
VNAQEWNRVMVTARAEAALSAYTTVLDWLRRYPVCEVEARLVETIAAKRATIGAPHPGQLTTRDESSAT